MAAKKNGNGNGGKEVVETGGGEEFSALSQLDTFQDLVAQNIGAGGISAFELDRIQVPAGGSTMWTINTLEGEEAVKEIEGIIVHMTRDRTGRRALKTAAAPPLTVHPTMESWAWASGLRMTKTSRMSARRVSSLSSDLMTRAEAKRVRRPRASSC